MKMERAVVVIASLMAVASGVLLVYAPWSVTTSSSGYAGAGRFFLFYVIFTISTNIFSGRFVDTLGGYSSLLVCVVLRVALLLFWAALARASIVHHWMITVILAAMASVPDSLYRNSISSITKAGFQSEELLRINGSISAWRQIGYIIGTLLGAVAVSTNFPVFIYIQLTISVTCIGLLILIRHVARFPQSPDIDTQKRRIGFGIGADAAHFVRYDSPALMVTLVLFGSAVVLLPMNAAPYILKVKQLPSFNLGLVEAAFSLGTLAGALYFSRPRGQIIQLISCATLAISVGTIPYAASTAIIVLYFMIGLSIQVSIPLGTALQIRCPTRLIGQVAALISLLGSVIAASVMMFVSNGNIHSPNYIYYLLCVFFVVVFVLALFHFNRAVSVNDVMSQN